MFLVLLATHIFHLHVCRIQKIQNLDLRFFKMCLHATSQFTQRLITFKFFIVCYEMYVLLIIRLLVLNIALFILHQLITQAEIKTIKDISPSVKELDLHVKDKAFFFKAGQWYEYDLFLVLVQCLIDKMAKTVACLFVKVWKKHKSFI